MAPLGESLPLEKMHQGRHHEPAGGHHKSPEKMHQGSHHEQREMHQGSHHEPAGGHHKPLGETHQATTSSSTGTDGDGLNQELLAQYGAGGEHKQQQP